LLPAAADGCNTSEDATAIEVVASALDGPRVDASAAGLRRRGSRREKGGRDTVWVMHNQTPFAVDRACYRDRRGVEVWMGVLRASFDVGQHGRVKRAEAQTPPLRAATWSGEPGNSSLLDDVDLQVRGGTDLLIRGHACAPGGKSVRQLDVGWRLGSLSKSVRVHGERRWVRREDPPQVVPGPANVFDRVPLVYERAFGGFDPNAPSGTSPACAANPVGTGFTHHAEAWIDRAAPQLEHPNVELVAGPDQVAPAGFGPIAPHWQPRVGLAGTYDAAGRANRAPLPPDDYREEFVRSAPPDQQLSGFLRGGEVIELTNMTPDGVLRVQLPELRVRMLTTFSDGTEHSEGRLQLVRLLPDERRVELSWAATVPCQGREHKLLHARLRCEGDRSWL
jgi:hypothetical protein